MSENIREAIPSKDAKPYGRLQIKKAKEGFGPKTDLLIKKTEKWEDRLRRKSITLIAENNSGDIIGTSGAQILKDGKTANLRGLYVLPEERRKGLGTKLVRETLTLLRSRGVETVLTEIDVGNTGSLIQHLALGFEVLSTVKDGLGKHYKKLRLALY